MKDWQAEVKKKGLCYLASPYSHADRDVVEWRATEVTKKAAQLMQLGYAIFSPIVHSHPLADHMDEALRFDHSFWLAQDFAVLDRCDALFVYQLPGWEQSFGVNKEIERAHARRIPVQLIPYEAA